MANPLTATVTPCGVVRMRKGGWTSEMPAADLPDFLRLYRALRDRHNGKYARFYADDVAALEAVQRELEEQHDTRG